MKVSRYLISRLTVRNLGVNFMPSYLTPGVYIELVPSGGATLAAGLTAVAAFVGFTESYPTDDPSDPQGLKPRLRNQLGSI